MRYGLISGLIYQAGCASVSREKKYLKSSRDGRTYMFNFHTFFVNFFIASNIHPSIHTHTHSSISRYHIVHLANTSQRYITGPRIITAVCTGRSGERGNVQGRPSSQRHDFAR